MIDFGKTIGHGNWGSLRYGIVSVDGKKLEVAVKQPKGESFATLADKCSTGFLVELQRMF